MIWKDILTVSFSGLAVFMSAYALFKNRKNLTVTLPDNLEIIAKDQIVLTNSNGDVSTLDNGFLYTLQIVNPSPNDIAYFDLRAFSPDNNLNTYALTRKALSTTFKDAKIFKYDGDESYELEIPDKNYGVFKANSYTHLDLFILPQPHIKNNIVVSFKIAKSALLKDSFAVTNRKRYKFYSTNFDISNSTLLRISIEQDKKQQ
ncbi:hypothetical protein HCB41_00220 [Listeria welshimeri]|nr:hypothetical protein [Listeria welshimeri]MBC2295081.1 hypothetical protein [Listeria welshimeri]